MKKYVLVLLHILVLNKIIGQTAPSSSVPVISPNGIFDIAYDRFGNSFFLADLDINAGRSIGGPFTVSLMHLSGIEDGLKLFPNPAKDYLELKIPDEKLLSGFKIISIYNLYGQKIKEEAVKQQIQTGSLAEGAYFLELSGWQGTVRKRFVISR